MNRLHRVVVVGSLFLLLVITAVAMIVSGFVPANGWSSPQHEVCFGMVAGGMVGVMVTIIIMEAKL